MTPTEEKKLSKFLSLVLRHDPTAAGVTLDPGGWIEIDALIAGAASRDVHLTRDELAQIVENSDKKRFTISEDGNAIRAAQGHSVTVDLALVVTIPPTELFHGTAESNIASILSVGLHAGSRQYVHLSPDVVTARSVGARHGRPVVFRVDAERATADGHAFFRAENGVWLTHPLPARYLALVDEQ